jgi:hypothetical protein
MKTMLKHAKRRQSLDVLRLELSPADEAPLRAAAAQRGLQPAALCGQVMHYVLADALIDAVIDR